MKKSSTIFLQFVLVALGLAVFAGLLWEPWIEGVNAHATTFSEVYFDDPFLAYVYLGSIPFFVALYQAFKVLGYAGENNVFSHATVKAFKTIKRCAVTTAGAIVAADVFLMINARLHPDPIGPDGPEGAVMLGIIATFASVIVATAAAIIEKVLQNAVDIKSENDLTV